MSISLTRWLAGAALVATVAAPSARSQNGAPRYAARDTLARDSTARDTTNREAAGTQQRDTSTTVEIYGFAQADAIHDFNSTNPDWFDVNRPSRLPSFEDEHGEDHHTFFSIRQSRFGAKAVIPTRGAPITAVFEWDLFGVGTDAGQTTIRPRHIYGQWGAFGGGQTNSPFMDVDVFPNILDYWGPNGMLFFRNVMLFWQPIRRDDGTRATIALERPGASGDQGVVADRIDVGRVRSRFPAPDLSAEYRQAFSFGYVELGGMLRYLAWDDLAPDTLDLSGNDVGWGVALSSNIRASDRDVFRVLAIVGEGVQNYFNDAPVDVGARFDPDDFDSPIDGEALGNFGLSAYLDHSWNSRWSSAIGYSRVDIRNSNLQDETAFETGQYASVNLLWSPLPRIMTGTELQWAHRSNFGDNFDASDFRLQVSAKYSFTRTFGGFRL